MVYTPSICSPPPPIHHISDPIVVHQSQWGELSHPWSSRIGVQNKNKPAQLNKHFTHWPKTSEDLSTKTPPSPPNYSTTVCTQPFIPTTSDTIPTFWSSLESLELLFSRCLKCSNILSISNESTPGWAATPRGRAAIERCAPIKVPPATEQRSVSGCVRSCLVCGEPCD